MRSALLHCYLFLNHTGRAQSGVSDSGLSESWPCAAIWAVLMRLCAVGVQHHRAVVATVHLVEQE